MSQEMYSKYINFLKKYELFDKATYDYITKNARLINCRKFDKDFHFGCSIVTDKTTRTEKLIDVIPCIPFLKNDLMVVTNIYVYVQALVLLPKMGKKYEETIYETLLPLLFVKLYILENKNEALLKYEKEILNQLFEDRPNIRESILQFESDMLMADSKGGNSICASARKLRRQAKDYVYKNNANKNGANE